MNIIPVSPAEYTYYDTYVSGHPSGSFLQSRSWGDFQNTSQNQAFRYLFTKNGKYIGSAQVFLKKVPGLHKEYLYCPYGPLTDTTVDIQLFIDFLKKIFPAALFIRLEPKDALTISGMKTLRIQPKDTVINDLTKSQNDILSGMHQKTRYNIKLAVKHGVKVMTIQPHNPLFAQALHLLEETSQRQGFKNFPRSYFEKILSSLDMATMYIATYKDQLLASAIMLDYAGTRTYLYGGSSSQDRNVMAPYALHWQAMQDAKSKGFHSYDWWGLRTSDGKTAGFSEFKLRFGGVELHYPEAIDIPLHRAWYTIYTLLRKLNRIWLHLPFMR